MKKLLILFCAILPTVVSADYLDDKIIALTKQKQEKIAVLEECQKSKGGLMVAGITTLGVSAIGIGANIGEAVKIKDLDKDIDAAKKDKLDLDAQITTIKMQIAADNTCGGDECAGDGAAAVAVLNGNAPICINNMWRVRMCNEGFSGQHRMCKRKGFVESYIDVCTKITKPENVIVEDLGNGNYEVKVTVDGKVVHEHKLVAAGGIEKITEVPSNPANQMPPININVHGGSGGNANGGNANIGNANGGNGGGYDVEYKDAQGNTYHYHIGTININNGTIINGNVNNGTINNGDINNIDGGSGVKGNGGIGWTFSGYGSFIDGKINVVKGNNGVLNFSGIGADMEITAVSDNTSVATVSVNGNTVTINPIGVGTANVKVTVKNKTTKDVIWENTIPVNVSESTVNIGGGNGGIGWTFSGYGSFIDGKINVVKGNNGVLNFSGIGADMEITAVSDNTSVATVSVNGNTVTINPIGVGTANVKVTVKNKTTKDVIWENTIPVNVSESTVNIGGGNGGSGGNNTITFTNNANPGDTLGCGGTITIQQDAKQQWTINGLTISDDPAVVANDSIATVTKTQSTITVIGGKTIGETSVKISLTDEQGNNKTECTFKVTTVTASNNVWVEPPANVVKITMDKPSNSEVVCGGDFYLEPEEVRTLTFSESEIDHFDGVATHNKLANVETINNKTAIKISALSKNALHYGWENSTGDTIYIYLKKGGEQYKCSIRIKIVAQEKKLDIAPCKQDSITIDTLLNSFVFSQGVKFPEEYTYNKCNNVDMGLLAKENYVLRANKEEKPTAQDCMIVGCKGKGKYLVVSDIDKNTGNIVVDNKYKTGNACASGNYDRLMFSYKYKNNRTGNAWEDAYAVMEIGGKQLSNVVSMTLDKCVEWCRTNKNTKAKKATADCKINRVILYGGNSHSCVCNPGNFYSADKVMAQYVED